MASDRFSYICRSACACLSDKDDVSSYLSNIDKQPSTQLYGKDFNQHSLYGKILNQVSKVESTYDALDILTLYKDLNLAGGLEQPMKIKRVFAYLFSIFIVFLVTSAIFQFFITPTIYNFAVDSGYVLPSNAVWYQENWGYIVSLISLFFVACLLIISTFKQMFSFEIDIEKGIVFKYLLFKSVRQSYFNIIDILQFPVTRKIETTTSINSKLMTHLKEIDNSKLNIATEMQALLRIELNTLVDKCEKQMKLISIIIASTIIYSIFSFLTSIYSPIFTLGEIV
jgi:hypothetical protein